MIEREAVRYRVAPAVLAAALLLFLAPFASAEDLVPDAVGLPLERARSLIEQAGYVVALRHDAGRPAGVVFAQAPGGFATRAKGTTVTLEVGGSAPAAAIPFVPPTGPAPVRPEPSAPMRVTPGAGTAPGPALPKDPLDLGEPPTGRPDRPSAAAVTKPGVPTQPALPTGPRPVTPAAPVQPAAPRATAPAGPLDARLARFPFAQRVDRNGAEVPDALGRTRAEARAALTGWTVREELTLAVPSLVSTVINQWPLPGKTLAPGEIVTLQVAVAQSPSDQDRSVPVLLGRTLGDIERVLARYGFAPEFRKVRSAARRYGQGVWQQPLPGSLAPKGSPVVVHIGIGDGTPRGADLPARPLQPTPFQPTPTQPTPGQPTPGQPTPTQPTPRQPTPGQPTPTQPTPGQPGPAQPGSGRPSGPPAGMPALPALGSGEPTPRSNPRPEPVRPPLGLPPTKRPTPTPPPTRRPTPVPAQPPTVVPPTPPTGMKSPLGRPTLILPAAGENYPRAYGATFEWSAVRGATGYEWVIEQEQPSGAWRKTDQQAVQGTRYRPDRVKRGRYRWRVRAKAGDRTSDWSAWFRLYMY